MFAMFILIWATLKELWESLWGEERGREREIEELGDLIQRIDRGERV